MNKSKGITRRFFARSLAVTGIGSLGLPLMANNRLAVSGQTGSSDSRKLKIALNAYSFDKPLRAGTMTIEDMLDFCAKTGFEGVDLTGYYFPGYPAAPPDSYIFKIKRKAFRLGIDLGCTGVKNDFTWSDPAKRKEEKKLVKDWVVVAQKLGAPGLRIFGGTLSKESFKWEERAKWITDDIRECADFAGEHGVMLALQNHNDFIKTATDVERMMTMINHEWVGLMLDIGSYHSPDPYKDIETTAKYAITWQMKEKVFVNETQVDTDYNKIIDIVRKCGYRGYLPLETLGEGDPATKITTLFNKVNNVLNG
jgi:sugar phosphate isomerase/epimerase